MHGAGTEVLDVLYREHATNRAHLTLNFLFCEVGITIFQFWYLNKINGSLDISVEK